jgi:hypothetical protein
MPSAKGGCIDRAYHKSEIEEMMERAAAGPGPGEVLPPAPLRLISSASACFLHNFLSTVNALCISSH